MRNQLIDRTEIKMMRLGLRNGIGIHWITVRMKTKCENEE